MIETDAIEACIAIAFHPDFDDGRKHLHVVKAKEQLAALKALEPQWLPAGVLPDADGWWLWKPLSGSEVIPIEVHMLNGHPYDQEYDWLYSFDGDGDRFAKLPQWEGPKD